MATELFYVTRMPGSGFVATLSLREIRSRLTAGQLQESFCATESDGRSFTQFQKDGAGGRWRTLAELLDEYPEASAPPSPDEAMPVRLMNCPACARQISTQAEFCPQCGHPNRGARPLRTGPRCYACADAATTRCQSCGALSCAQHLQSIYVSHGKGGAYELRCETCYSNARAWQWFGFGIAVISIIVVLMIWSQIGRH